MKDGAGGRVDVVPAGGAGPRLAPLLGRVALEAPINPAARAVGVLPVRRVPGAPQVLQAGVVIGEVPQELGDRVVGGRGLDSTGACRLAGGTDVKLLDMPDVVKSVDKS